MAMAMQHDEQGWSSMASWHAPCGGNTWSKRLASAMDNDSWEVRAFAEDASSSGQWPPRSYSCSFCQREFRTAQALGGHMNVHRRERAHANQLAQVRSAAAAAAVASPKAGAGSDTDLSWLQARLPALPAPPRTADLLSPGQSLSLSMSGPASPLVTSPESISSGARPLFQSIPDILCESLSSASRAFHPYEKPRAEVNLGRFSTCLTKLMGEPDETVLDLELRLGQSSSSCLA
jgi:hypothetical protein